AIVEVPYQLSTAEMHGVWTDQGYMAIALKSAGREKKMKLAYNTWPVIIDVDFYRHYSTPDENPQPVSINLGVAEGTLAKTKALSIEIRRRRDDKVVDKIDIPDLHQTMAGTSKNFASLAARIWKTPNPVEFADRKNLVALRLDLSKVPVHAQTEPTRDHYLF